MKAVLILILALILIIINSRTTRAQRREPVPKCNDKCRKCSDKLNPYENRCENSISLKGIEVKGITEEDIRCCEYRMQWHCLYSYAPAICTEEEAMDLKRFAEYNVENILGTKCSDIHFGDGFCRNRSSAPIEWDISVNTISLSSVVIVWLLFEVKCI